MSLYSTASIIYFAGSLVFNVLFYYYVVSENVQMMERSLDELETQQKELKDICQQLIKRRKKPFCLFKKGQKNESNEKETEAEIIPADAQRWRPEEEEEEEGGLVKWIQWFQKKK